MVLAACERSARGGEREQAAPSRLLRETLDALLVAVTEATHLANRSPADAGDGWLLVQWAADSGWVHVAVCARSIAWRRGAVTTEAFGVRLVCALPDRVGLDQIDGFDRLTLSWQRRAG